MNLTRTTHSDRTGGRGESGAKPGLAPTFVLIGIVCVALALVSGLMIMTFQRGIAELARSTRDDVLPVVFEHHRTALNVERLSQLGERVYLSRDPAKRRQARIAARVLAQDSVFERDRDAHVAVKDVYTNIAMLERLRTEQDQLRANMRGLLGSLSQAEAELESIRLEAARKNSRQALLWGGLLLDLHRLQIVAVRANQGTQPGQLARERTVYSVVSRELMARIDFLERRLGPDDKRKLASIKEFISQGAQVYTLQESVLAVEARADRLWRKSRHRLEALAGSLSSDAAVIAADRFTEIHEDAMRAMWLSVLGMGVVVVLVAVIAVLVRLHVVMPLVAATRGLEVVQVKREAVSLPENRLRELDAIRLAVERLGVVLQQSGRYARELETANRSLEVEVAERMRAQRELAKAKEIAESAATAKSDFLASMSHEIRTPMNAILGMADMLSETELTSDQRRYVDVFRASGEMLLELLNDILDLSKVEAGRVELESIEFNLYEVLKGACDMVAFKAQAKGLRLDRVVGTDVPPRVVGDPVRLKQVLGNLLGNAVKFTEHGGVTVRLEPEPELGPAGVRITVSDTGPGIADDMQEHIFEAFTQADSSTTRKYGGTGLGLAVSRQLVELMGGSMWVESEVGRGSMFTVLLPFPDQPSAAPPLQAEPRVPVGVRTLVAESDDIQRMVMVENLLGLGARVEDVSTFREAVAALAHAEQANAPYGIVFLDCGLADMPVGPNPEQALTAQLARPPEVLLVADTTEAGEGEEPPVVGAATGRALSRPVGRHTLERALKRVFRDAPAQAGAQPLTLGASGRLRVLLVEDIQSNRALVELYLRDANCELSVAENGLEGMERYKTSGADIILMDMQMPVMDGFTATSSIRTWERDKGMDPVPIIALTAHAYKDDVERCLRVGCTGYLAKPVKKADLLETLFRHSVQI